MDKTRVLKIMLFLLVLATIIFQDGQAQQGEIEIGQTVLVATSGQNLNLRAGPGTNYGIVANLPNGTLMTVLSGPVSAGGFTWWEIEGSPGRGWAAGDYLRPASGITANTSAITPGFIWPLSAPWPAGITLHSAGDGNGYGDGGHIRSDQNAIDFNGWPNVNSPPVESNDQDLLVLSVADGCVKSVTFNPGRSNLAGDWLTNYGWNVVISHIGGYEIRYAHLKEKPLVEGPLQSLIKGCKTWVTQGQPIGQIGGTGTNPDDPAIHLHFAIYYCNPSIDSCQVQSVVPEPLDGVSPLADYTKVTSENFSVAYEAIQGSAITNPNELHFHPAIYNEYKYLGGQEYLFGRAVTPVVPVQLGAPMYYQAFLPHALMSTFSTSILEYNQRAFMMPKPIFDAYVSNYSFYGTPVSQTYITHQAGTDIGWRTDFSDASLFWHWGLTQPITWNQSNAPWEGSFCPQANNFSCTPVSRFDPDINFHFSDSNNPGPYRNSHGFSATWVRKMDGSLISNISIGYEIQGHVRFYIDNRPQGEWVNSEDGGQSGVTQPTWHTGENTFRIDFWQAPGKPALIRINILQDNILESAQAAETAETYETFAYQPPQSSDFADFTPPDYPGEDTPSWDLGQWLEDLIAQLQQSLSTWWQNQTEAWKQAFQEWLQQMLENLAKDLENAVAQILYDIIEAIQMQCSGIYLLVIGSGIGLAYANRRKRP